VADLDRQADCHASGTVRTAAFAVKEHRELTLCGHCVGVQRRALEAEGWVIIPAHTPTPGTGIGTEATGQHFALEAP
jgi:hypothetical protein